MYSEYKNLRGWIEVPHDQLQRTSDATRIVSDRLIRSLGKYDVLL
jgi:hypothetical protein